MFLYTRHHIMGKKIIPNMFNMALEDNVIPSHKKKVALPAY